MKLALLSTRTASHGTGYRKINLAHTVSQMDNLLIVVKPYAHQFAIVAKGQAESLLLRNWQASHLWHHATCFNPAYITMEPWSENVARNTHTAASQYLCKRARIDPCPHGAGTARMQCILPKIRMNAQMAELLDIRALHPRQPIMIHGDHFTGSRCCGPW